jgi:hypothetical protein
LDHANDCVSGFSRSCNIFLQLLVLAEPQTKADTVVVHAGVWMVMTDPDTLAEELATAAGLRVIHHLSRYVTVDSRLNDDSLSLVIVLTSTIGSALIISTIVPSSLVYPSDHHKAILVAIRPYLILSDVTST